MEFDTKGTRGAIGVIIDNEEKVTYNHYDSYPEELGIDVVNDTRKLLKKFGVDGLKKLAKELRLVKGNSKPSKVDIKRFGQYADTDVGNQTIDDWYCLTRELQGKFYETIMAGVMVDSHEFLNDSLFCEYAYILNLNTGMLEFYQGFQESPPKGRYGMNMPADFERRKKLHGTVYYSVGLVGECPMTKIPRNWQKKFYPPREGEE